MSLKSCLLPAVLAFTLSGCQAEAPEAAAPSVAAMSPEKKDAAPAAGMTEEAFRKGMALEDVKELQYVGDAGEPLSFAEFIALAQAGGRSFKKIVEADKSRAILTINPKDKASPKQGETASRSQPLNFHVSAELPAITGRDLGERLNVLANGRHYTLVSFFFAECVPCIQEIPALNALAGEQGDLNVVSMTFDTRETASKFAKERGLKTSIVPDAQAYIDALGIKVYPTLILVSPEGRLMGVRSSYKVESGAKDAGLADIKSWVNSLGLDI
jgi:thiol-disulfide isomerase/thioredoxin